VSRTQRSTLQKKRGGARVRPLQQLCVFAAIMMVEACARRSEACSLHPKRYSSIEEHVAVIR